MKKMPTMATGTVHSGKSRSVKPWSSSGLSSAGIKGSVAAPAMVAAKATIQARRWLPK